MSKNQKSNKESKKKALLTPKEKKAAKRDKAPINTLVGDAIDNGKHHRQQGK